MLCVPAKLFGKTSRRRCWKQCLNCWVPLWYLERNDSSLLSTHSYHIHRKTGYPYKIPLPEHLKPSWFQMFIVHRLWEMCTQWLLNILLSDLCCEPGSTSRANSLESTVCMEANHVQYLCWWGDLGCGDLSLLGSAPWGHSLPNTAASGSAWAANPAAQPAPRGSLL